jgi:Ni,Fe-hydrogenase III small subunit
MTKWVLKGLRTGIKTTPYPNRQDESAGLSPGRPSGGPQPSASEAAALATRCPTDAITSARNDTSIDFRHCVLCFRCQRDTDGAVIEWEPGYEWAARDPSPDAMHGRLTKAFGRSLHIRFLDAGACGACMSEARQINNPYYNIHRLGFFVTPTPRNADILLVAGPVTDAMRLPLQKTYDAMPAPKRVVAIGVCALSGGVFGPSFAAGGGVADVIPVDVMVPGCPPPPLAILHGLLVAVERKPPAVLQSPAVGEVGPA